MKILFRIAYKAYNTIDRVIYKYFMMPFKRAMLKKCGKNVIIGKSGDINYKYVAVGDCVSIGRHARFMCSSRGEIRIGNHVMFAPHVFFITGDHRTDIIGRYMDSVKNSEKLIENDADIIVEDDCWIGANTTILKGVTIGRGSIVAAGSVVTKNIPPYSISAGIPAKVIKFRFNKEQIREHEDILDKLCEEKRA